VPYLNCLIYIYFLQCIIIVSGYITEHLGDMTQFIIVLTLNQGPKLIIILVASVFIVIPEPEKNVLLIYHYLFFAGHIEALLYPQPHKTY